MNAYGFFYQGGSALTQQQAADLIQGQQDILNALAALNLGGDALATLQNQQDMLNVLTRPTIE